MRGDPDVDGSAAAGARHRPAAGAGRRAARRSALVAVATFLMVALTDFTLDQVLFEVISAFATVGLSTGITADLPPAGQVLLVAADVHRPDRAAHPGVRRWRCASAPAATGSPRRGPSLASAAQRAAVVVIGLGRFGTALAWNWTGAAPRCSPSTPRRTSSRGCPASSPTSSRPTPPARPRCARSARRLQPGRRRHRQRHRGQHPQPPACWSTWRPSRSGPRRSPPAGRILERVGAHHVVFPEQDMGERVAHLVAGRLLDYIEFDDDFAIVKTRAPARDRATLGRDRAAQEVRRDGRRREDDRARTSPTPSRRPGPPRRHADRRRRDERRREVRRRKRRLSTATRATNA